MGCRPAAGMTGGAVAASGEVLADRQAPEAAVRVVTAGTAVMGISCSTDQGVVVAVGAAGRCDLHQGAVIRGRYRVGRYPGIRMAGGTVAAAGRDAGLQVRHGGMTEVAITAMGYGYRAVDGRTGIVTAHAGGRSSGNIAQGCMIDVGMGRRLGRVTIQAVGGVGARCDGVDDLLSRAVVAGSTGAGPVGGDIVRGAFDLSPVRHHMTVAAGGAARKVAASQRNSMRMGCMRCFPASAMTGGAVAASGEVFADRQAPEAAVRIVTAGTAVMGISCSTDQGVVVAAGADCCTHPDQGGMVWRGRMERIPAAGMTGGAVAARGEGLSDRQAPEAAVRVVTAGTAIMGRNRATDQGVVVAVGAAGRCDLYQGIVHRGRHRVGRFPGIRMTGGAVAAAGWNPGLQVRHGGMAESTIIVMNYAHGSIGGRTGIVTDHAGGRSASHIAERQMVGSAMRGQLLV